MVLKAPLCLSLCIGQSLAEVATLVARALYLQAGGAESQLSSITADPLTVRHRNPHVQWGKGVL